jgi:hypothetical protein
MNTKAQFKLSGVAIAFSLALTIGCGNAEAGCKSGFVWRDAKDGDGVCVTPAERTEAKQQNANASNNRRPGGGQYGPNTCRDGYVWREAFANDVVCVTPTERQKAQQQNALNAQRSTASAPPPPRPTAPPAASNERCKDYAKYAVADYNQANGLLKCSQQMKQENPGRWHTRFDQHYNWCLTAQQAWLTSEVKARDALLVSCGGRSRL